MENVVVKNGAKIRKNAIDHDMAKRFEINKRVGQGGFGVVWKATDRKTREVVALKKVIGAFRNAYFAKRTYREVALLKAFSNHENIIQLRSIHRAGNNIDIYLGFEFMETDLEIAIAKKCLNDEQKKFIMYQVLCATKYIHAGNVIHRDQKPSNILLDYNCKAKLADFGLARSINNPIGSEPELDVLPIYTSNLGTRWYKAPEILIEFQQYTTSVDMWSLGCILAEMHLGEVLFRGTCRDNQVEKILAALHESHQLDIDDIVLAEDSRQVYDQIKNGKALCSILEEHPEDASDLIQKLLMLNPDLRLTAEEALNHRYINKSEFLKTNACEIAPIKVLLPINDCVQFTTKAYMDKLYEFINEGPLLAPSDKPEDHSSKPDGPGRKNEQEKITFTRRPITASRKRNKGANREKKAATRRKPKSKSPLHRLRPRRCHNTRLRKIKKIIIRRSRMCPRNGKINTETFVTRKSLRLQLRRTVQTEPGRTKDLQPLQTPDKQTGPE